ncbi:MoaD/ThiS family protein [Halanaerobaculum tunisiense]
MKVEVKLFSGLQDKCKVEEIPGIDIEGELKEAVIDIEEGSTLDNLIDRLGLKDIPLIIMINGKKTRKDEENILLEERDRIGIFPPVGGG